MRRLAELIRQLAYRLRGERHDVEIDDEMRLHLELRAEQARARGLDPDAARAEARRRFGNPGVLREEGRDAWGWAYLDGWARDLREAWRTLRGSPGFAAVAVISLALGIGANTAIFGLINALLLRNLPVEDPSALVQVTLDEWDTAYFTNPIWEEVRDHQRALEGVLAFSYARFDLSQRGEARLADGLWVSGDFFSVLGVPALRGRVFTREDDRRGCGPDGPVAVISERLWKTRYGLDEDIVGRSIYLDRVPFRIVGVTPAWFTGLDTDRAYEVAVPLGCDALLHRDGSWLDMRSRWWLRVLGRLSPATPVQAAAGHLKALSPRVFESTVPPDWVPQRQDQYGKHTLGLRPVSTGFSGIADRYGQALYLLMGVAALVLLIACANLANLLLARSSRREQEISLRMALGAGRARLVRRLLCESLLLAAAGAGAGLALAVAGSRLLVRLVQTGDRTISIDVYGDARVLAFAIAAALLTSLLFGLAPALRATRAQPNSVMKEGARGVTGARRGLWLGKTIVAAQIALSLVLLTGASLFAGTLYNLANEDLGFDSENVLIATVDLEKAGIPEQNRPPAFDSILQRLRNAPAVEAAAMVELSPLSGYGRNGAVEPEGYEPTSREDGMMLFNVVSPGYFEAMGTSLLLGRDFDAGDVAGSQPVIVVDEATARRFWGAENPIGKRITLDLRSTEDVQFEVIGVIEPVKYQKVSEELRSVGFLAAAQAEEPLAQACFVVRGRRGVSELTSSVRQLVAEVAPEASLGLRALDDQVDDTMREHRLVAFLSLAFGGLALVLAMIGLYGVTAHAAARRRGEVGLRIALGARPASVVWLMVRDLAVAFCAGLALGCGAALTVGGVAESLLFGVEPGDPWLLGLAAVILAGVCALAAYVPARRASKLQPIAVLREE